MKTEEFFVLFRFSGFFFLDGEYSLVSLKQDDMVHLAQLYERH